MPLGSEVISVFAVTNLEELTHRYAACLLTAGT